MSEPSAALYRLRVTHQRRDAVRHAFAYRITSLLVDLDALPALAKRLRLFSYNGWGAIAHRDSDHGPHDGSPLRPWVERRLAQAGIEIEGGAIRLLAMPRVLGGQFNPLSLYFCHGPDGLLRGVIHEVHNTFGQHHSYVLPVAAEAAAGPVRQACAKSFYVSPFIAMQQHYSFRLTLPGERFSFAMQLQSHDKPFFFAAMHGRREALSDATLARMLLRHPALGWKVLGAIHWEALRLWWKGAKFHPRPKDGRPTTEIAPISGRERKV